MWRNGWGRDVQWNLASSNSQQPCQWEAAEFSFVWTCVKARMTGTQRASSRGLHWMTRWKTHIPGHHCQVFEILPGITFRHYTVLKSKDHGCWIPSAEHLSIIWHLHDSTFFFFWWFLICVSFYYSWPLNNTEVRDTKPPPQAVKNPWITIFSPLYP